MFPAPNGGDGVVNFRDWALFTGTWQNTTNINDLAVFVGQWLSPGAWCADIAPTPHGDGIVNWHDFAIFTDHWLAGVE